MFTQSTSTVTVHAHACIVTNMWSQYGKLIGTVNLHWCIIIACTCTGIWVRDIKFKSNLVQTQVQKILKTLESKKLVKPVKSVQVCNV